MQPFKRTTEKVLAWIANTLLFIFTGALGLAISTGLGKQLAENPDFIKERRLLDKQQRRPQER